MKEQNGLLGTHELQTNYIPSCKPLIAMENHHLFFPDTYHQTGGKLPAR